MAIVYVGTDGAKWGSGVGRRLTVSEHDNNNWQLHERILDLETATGAGITGFSVTGATGFMVHMEDGTDFGPYALPLAVFEPRGEFLGGASYNVNDVFYINAKLYYVNIAHVAVAPFDANRNDGLGNYYYTLLIEMPTASLPTGGATAYNLRKQSSDDYDYAWAPPLPLGGQTGYLLAKTSSTDFAADWIEPPTPLPSTGPTGYFLGLNSSAVDDFDWLPPLPLGGGTGYILAKLSDADLDYDWVDPATVFTGSTGGGGTILVTGATGIGTSYLAPVDRAKYLITPTGNVNVVTDPFVGNFDVIITTTGSTSFNVAFSSGFVSQGALWTSTAAGKRYVVSFVGGEDAAYEVARSPAM